METPQPERARWSTLEEDSLAEQLSQGIAIQAIRATVLSLRQRGVSSANIAFVLTEEAKRIKNVR